MKSSRRTAAPLETIDSASIRSDMIQRTTSSEGAGGSSTPPVKLWSLTNALGKIRSINKEERLMPRQMKRHHSQADSDTNESVVNAKSPDLNITSSPALDNPESSLRQLQSVTQKLRSAPAGPSHVDAAYKDFIKFKDQGSALCRQVLVEELRRSRDVASDGPDGPRRESSMEFPRSPGAIYDTRSSFSGRSLAEVVSGSAGRVAPTNDPWLNVIRDWKAAVEALTENFKQSLADTYKSYERDATPEMVEALFTNRRFRRDAVHRMRNASVTRVMSADPQFFPRYEIRFRNYEKVRQELSDIQYLYQMGESGISPDRALEEHTIAAKGDTVLEFVNNYSESAIDEPALRFRVSSYYLAETSPIFARMFAGHSASIHSYDDEDLTPQLPAPPTKFICKDGTEAKLYRMPQNEINRFKSLEILLHAAHMHHDEVPRQVSFEQFVAIAECCMRYKCTSPLELVVEHRWLPQWMHKGADEMPDGLLVISYAFGLRQLFARTSKTAILNLADERELQAKPWPAKIKNKVWAVRSAKVAQLHACCISTVQEYLRAPLPTYTESTTGSSASSDHRSGSFSSQSPPTMALTSAPRCPKGSHWCDATNLGWLMLVYNEMNLLPEIVKPSVLAHLPNSQPQPRSLSQIVDALRRVPVPPTPVHRGVCDPGPAFRTAINDIFNSVLGLTLYDISGRSHGWALSKHREREPQSQLNKGLNRMAVHDHNHSVATEFPEKLRLRIMCELDQLEDLQAAAMMNRAFYETYKQHELFLMRNILRLDRKRGAQIRHLLPPELSAEDKVRKLESDVLKSTPVDARDAISLRSDDDGGEYTDYEDDASLFDSAAPSTVAPSIHESAGVESLSGDTETEASQAQADSDDADLDRDSSASTPKQHARDPPRTLDDPSEPEEVPTEDIDEPPLTEEEALRILWPDSAVKAVASMSARPAPPSSEGLREKFRLGDPVFVEELEDKSLAEAQLRSEIERRAGLARDANRQPNGVDEGIRGGGG